MKIFHYDSIFQTYLSEDVADPSPLEPGKYLVPAYATAVEPPVCEEGYVGIFNGGTWETHEDKRGTYYSLRDGLISTFFNYNPKVPPEDSTKEVPPEVSSNETLSWDGKWIITENLPSPELTPMEKLKKADLTINELKELLGLL